MKMLISLCTSLHIARALYFEFDLSLTILPRASQLMPLLLLISMPDALYAIQPTLLMPSESIFGARLPGGTLAECFISATMRHFGSAANNFIGGQEAVETSRFDFVIEVGISPADYHA